VLLYPTNAGAYSRFNGAIAILSSASPAIPDLITYLLALLTSGRPGDYHHRYGYVEWSASALYS
jgi:hypothetical protein